MRQAAVGGPFPEHFDHFVAVRVGHPERRPSRVQGRHIRTITPACTALQGPGSRSLDLFSAKGAASVS